MVGEWVGGWVGWLVGWWVGEWVGEWVGWLVGRLVGGCPGLRGRGPSLKMGSVFFIFYFSRATNRHS